MRIAKWICGMVLVLQGIGLQGAAAAVYSGNVAKLKELLTSNAQEASIFYKADQTESDAVECAIHSQFDPSVTDEVKAEIRRLVLNHVDLETRKTPLTDALERNDIVRIQTLVLENSEFIDVDQKNDGGLTAADIVALAAQDSIENNTEFRFDREICELLTGREFEHFIQMYNFRAQINNCDLQGVQHSLTKLGRSIFDPTFYVSNHWFNGFQRQNAVAYVLENPTSEEIQRLILNTLDVGSRETPLTKAFKNAQTDLVTTLLRRCEVVNEGGRNYEGKTVFHLAKEMDATSPELNDLKRMVLSRAQERATQIKSGNLTDERSDYKKRIEEIRREISALEASIQTLDDCETAILEIQQMGHASENAFYTQPT